MFICSSQSEKDLFLNRALAAHGHVELDSSGQCLKQFICIIWIYCVLCISFWQGGVFMFTGAASVTFPTLNCRKRFSSPVEAIVHTVVLNGILS